MAEAVLAGDQALTEAYEQVRDRQGAVKNERGRLTKLRDSNPDLADLVSSGKLSLQDAEAKAKKQADEIKQQRWAATVNIIDGVLLLDRSAEAAIEMAADYDPSVAESRGEKITPARLRRVAEFASTLADIMERNDEKVTERVLRETREASPTKRRKGI